MYTLKKDHVTLAYLTSNRLSGIPSYRTPADEIWLDDKGVDGPAPDLVLLPILADGSYSVCTYGMAVEICGDLVLTAPR